MEHTTEIDGLKMYYHTAGNKENPPLVFLHAWGAKLDWLPPVIEEFAKDFYVVAPEHPGLLRSQTPQFGAGQNSFQYYAGILDTLLKQLAVEKPVLVGNSFGGGIATAYAISHGENVRTLVLVDSVMAKEFGRTPYTLKRRARQLKLLESKLTVAFCKKLLLHFYLGTPLSFLAAEEVKRKIALFTFKHELVVDYAKLTLPVILVWGRQDTRIHPIVQAREVAAALPNGRFIEYDGSVPTIYKHPQRVIPLITKALV